MDWDNARVFLAIYRVGTLRGAAGVLQIDQATAGRRLAALEKTLGARLFLHTPAGYVATPAGELAFQAAERMEQAAHQLQRQMQGTDEQLSGTVRVACTDGTAAYAIMRAMQKLHAAHPEIRVVLTSSSQLSNLTRREADLAVRALRPDSPDLIARRLARLELGLYASRSYLAERGMPRQGSALEGHDVVIYQREVLRYQSETLCGEPIRNARVSMEVNTSLMLMHAVRNGLGIGELSRPLAETDPELRRIWPDKATVFDMWLVLHGDLNRSARVRAVSGAITEVFEELAGR